MALAITSICCDSGTASSTIIKNRTGNPVEVSLFSTNQGEVSKRTMKAEAREEIIIWHDSGLSSLPHTFLQDFDIDSIQFAFPEILLVTFTPDSPGKNPMDKDDWILKEKRSRLSGLSLFTIFEVKDEDVIAWQ